MLTQLRDMCLHEHWTYARGTDHRGLRRLGAGQSVETSMMPSRIAGSRGRPVRCGTPRLVRPSHRACSWRRCWAARGEADVRGAETAIERLAAAPIGRWRSAGSGCCGSRALLAARPRRRGRLPRCSASDIARWPQGSPGRTMAMADSWTVRAAAAGASRILSPLARMSQKPVWNRLIRWSTAPKRRR